MSNFQITKNLFPVFQSPQLYVKFLCLKNIYYLIENFIPVFKLQKCVSRFSITTLYQGFELSKKRSGFQLKSIIKNFSNLFSLAHKLITLNGQILMPSSKMTKTHAHFLNTKT